MPDAPETHPETLELLIELATLQRTLKPLQHRVDRLIVKRIGILKSLRQTGIDPKLIQQLTGVPLSTIYANTGKPIQKPGGRRKEG